MYILGKDTPEGIYEFVEHYDPIVVTEEAPITKQPGKSCFRFYTFFLQKLRFLSKSFWLDLWAHGLCNCCEEPDLCCTTFCCPCVTQKIIANHVGENGRDYCLLSLCVHVATASCFMIGFSGFVVRNFHKNYHIFFDVFSQKSQI